MDVAGKGIPSIENSPDPACSTAKDAVAAVGLAAVSNTIVPIPGVAVAGTVVEIEVPALLTVNRDVTGPTLTAVTLESAVPLMVTVAPTKADVGITLVIMGVAALTVSATTWLAAATETVKVVVPKSVNRGIPHRSPRVALIAAQSGSAPALIAHPPPAMAGEAVNW